MTEKIIHLGNLGTKAQVFLTGVVQLFTDPQFRKMLELLQAGRIAIQMDPAGRAHLCPIDGNEKANAIDLVRFISRFETGQWECLVQNKEFEQCLDVYDLARAGQIAEEMLGILPEAKLETVGRG